MHRSSPFFSLMPMLSPSSCFSLSLSISLLCLCPTGVHVPGAWRRAPRPPTPRRPSARRRPGLLPAPFQPSAARSSPEFSARRCSPEELRDPASFSSSRRRPTRRTQSPVTTRQQQRPWRPSTSNLPCRQALEMARTGLDQPPAAASVSPSPVPAFRRLQRCCDLLPHVVVNHLSMGLPSLEAQPTPPLASSLPHGPSPSDPFLLRSVRIRSTTTDSPSSWTRSSSERDSRCRFR